MDHKLLADIKVSVRILQKGGCYGYEIIMGSGQTMTGWTTVDGRALLGPLHAWRRALQRAKDQGGFVGGLVVDRRA